MPFSFNSVAETSVIFGPNTDCIVSISQVLSSGNVPDTPNLEYADLKVCPNIVVIVFALAPCASSVMTV